MRYKHVKAHKSLSKIVSLALKLRNILFRVTLVSKSWVRNYYRSLPSPHAHTVALPL